MIEYIKHVETLIENSKKEYDKLYIKLSTMNLIINRDLAKPIMKELVKLDFTIERLEKTLKEENERFNNWKKKGSKYAK